MSSLGRSTPIRLPLLLFTVALLFLILAAFSLPNAGAEGPFSEDVPFYEPMSPLFSGIASTNAYDNELTGQVYIWDGGQLRPAVRARVSTGTAQVRTDSNGRFEFTPDQRTGQISIVQPGYDVVRRPIYYDRTVVLLRELAVRAIYVPFLDMKRPEVQDFVHELVDADLINAVVIDIKDEFGRVYEFAATDVVRQVGAATDDGDLLVFLQSLEDRGVYRIGRIVTFLDRRYANTYPQHSLHNLYGGPFIDAGGSGWSSAYSKEARKYNIDIGIAATEYVEEIQYDYVRLPYESNLLERNQYSAADRVAAINRFAREAGDALHLAGVAVSFDTFGVVSTAGDDQGIGQSVAGVAPHLDYVSPMVYPSGWSPGSFGYAYPPEHPGVVVQLNVQATVDLIQVEGAALVRPWLQDFSDYQWKRLSYGSERVAAQIEATAAAGGFGFMLWDPSLSYELAALERALNLTWSPFG